MQWGRPLAAPSCDGWTAPHAGPTARAGDDLIRGALGQTYVGVPSPTRSVQVPAVGQAGAVLALMWGAASQAGVGHASVCHR